MRSLERAFTLIEILVVVTIVGIVLSIAILSIGVLGDDRDLETEARRLAALIDVAQDESMMQGREFGIEFMTDSYRFVEYDPLTGLWSEIIGDDTLRLRELPEAVEFDLYLDEQLVQLAAEPAEIPDEDDRRPSAGSERYAPHVFIFSSGDVTPFELRLYRAFDDRSVVLKGDFAGDVELVGEGAEL